MADPVVVPITKEGWRIVATNVTVGRIQILKVGPQYRHTYRATGNPAPTLAAEGALIEGLVLEISAAAAIDVYIWTDHEDGNVRADL